MFPFHARTQASCRRSFPRHLLHVTATSSVLLLTTAIPQLVFAQPPVAEQPSRPNVVLIVSDDQGYRDLGCFGKWDGGQLKRFLPLQQGFDDYYGFTNTGIDYYTHERYEVPSMRRGNDPTTADRGTYCTTLFGREATRFIKAHHAKPFFLYLPFNAPHGSSSLEPDIRGTVQAPPEYLALYPEGSTAAERRRRGYLAAITCMDDVIGQLLDLLETYKIADNTLVIFLSDNGGGGGSNNRPLRGGKSQMFEGGIRVPCIVRWPGRIPASGSSDEFLTSLEIFPTIASATGCPLPADVTLDGFDMLPVLRAEPSPRREMFWQRRDNKAARVGHWKWVESDRGGGLFDLSQDVGEQIALSEDESCPATAIDGGNRSRPYRRQETSLSGWL